MPSKSDKQHRLMGAVKHNPKFAKKVGIPQSVGRDFVAADKRTGRYAKGGKILRTKGIIDHLLSLGKDFLLDDSDVTANDPRYLAKLQKMDWGKEMTPREAELLVDDFDRTPKGLEKYSVLWDDPAFRGLSGAKFRSSRRTPQIFSANKDVALNYASEGDHGLLLNLLPTDRNWLLPNPFKSESELLLLPNRELRPVGKSNPEGMDIDRIDVKQASRYARGGSVLKALAEPRMRPVKPVKMPELREADRAITDAGERLRRLRKADGGKVKMIRSAASKIADLRARWREASQKYRDELPTLVDPVTGKTRKAKNWGEDVMEHLWGKKEE